MRHFRTRLKSSTYTYTKHNIRLTSRQVKQTANHSTIEFNVNVFTLFIFVKLCCCSHGSLAYLCIFKPEFLNKFSCVLGLIYVDPITSLFDLKFMKIVELLHHIISNSFFMHDSKSMQSFSLIDPKMILSTHIWNYT